MQVKCIDQTTRIGSPRGAVVVCICAYRGSESLARCVRSVLVNTPRDIPIVVRGEDDVHVADLEAIAEPELASEHPHELLYLTGRDRTNDAVFAITTPADVVLLSPDAVVTGGWIEGLRAAAYGDSRVATATALATGSLSTGGSLEEAAGAVRARSLKLRPRLVDVAGPCTYVRRTAIELVGNGIDAFGSAGDEKADFAERCIRNGLSHVLADDVLIGQDDPDRREPCSDSTIDRGGALPRALDCARRALVGLSVVVDARILSAPTTGTQVHTVELIAALARTDKLRLSAIVPDRLSEDAASKLECLSGITLVRYAQAVQDAGAKADVVHRPFQIDNPGELSFLATLANRLVITHQDLIGYHNPSYFASHEMWRGYRRLTRTALGVADRVLFFSDHVRNDALDEELVEADRASVVRIGVDHRVTTGDTGRHRPHDAARLPNDGEVILCIGNDYRHKNRLFALRLLDELQQRHDWRGWLVFAGPRVAHGSSALDERQAMARCPRLADAVLDLGAVSELEKDWLMHRAELVMYPTIDEGFGLVPFEAADRGVPCMWAAGASLSELLPDSAASIVAWDAQLSADAAIELLRDHRARERNVEVIRDAGAQLTWDAAAARLLDLYEMTCDQPATPVGSLQRRDGLMSRAISEDGLRLVGPGGALPTTVERPLLALATHPQIGAPVFRALELGYRASYKLRRWRGGRGSPQSRM